MKANNGKNTKKLMLVLFGKNIIDIDGLIRLIERYATFFPAEESDNQVFDSV